MPAEELIEIALSEAKEWYESHRSQHGNVNTNVMNSGMAIAELLRDNYPLTESAIKSEKNSQVKGLSGALIKRILARFGENRKFTSEGGRTSRGTIVIAKEFAEVLNYAFEGYVLTEEDRELIADALQLFFVQCVQRDYFDKHTIDIALDYAKPIANVIDDILSEASKRADNTVGVVAQHLVGAKLELRFPNVPIGRDKANSADMQTNRQGDFQINNTAFHVTVAPSAKLADRVSSNLRAGYRPMILVPESKVPFAVGLFDSEGLKGSVCIQSIESFVGTNIEEMAEYDSVAIMKGLAMLVRRYNERIAMCEIDQSLRITEPAWFSRTLDVSYGIEFL